MNELFNGRIKLYNDDCLESMKSIESGSVDMILTDPPYGTTVCKWDSVIPFEPMWEQLNRIIKPNGAIALFGSEPFSSALRMSNIKNYKYDWVWEKTKVSGFTNAKNKPLNTVENIICFSFGSVANGSRIKMKYNPQGLVRINKKKNGTRKPNDDHRFFRENNKKQYVQEFTNYPKNHIRIPSEFINKHPTQKPVALMEYLIKTYTNENETVLDFTFGSGTTGVACVRTNRKFMGIELDDEYYKTGLERITNETKQEVLF